MKDLTKLENDENIPEEQKPLYKLDIYNNMFSNLIEDTTIFKDILSRIKFEYDEYLFSLLRNQQKNNRMHLLEENDSLIQSKTRIEELDKEIKHIENLMKSCKLSNEDLEERIKLETANLKILKENNENQQEAIIQIKSEASSKKNEEENMMINASDTLEKRTNSIKDNIIQNLEKINSINQKLKNDFVPYVVINNLNQSIKDVEVSLF